ncbi:tRNA pseudouridine synthase A [Lachnospiraceae bacterium KM106-2]|nr:tRNA pseudouridine synthase A [Lachnospiraceae bacterium KM106-2]
MKRVLLKIAYDGTNYCGWQYQPNAITIEQKINEALSDLLGEKIEVIGASRTDSGVHAYGNVAVFDTETRIPSDKLMFALNQRLPEDIRIQDSFDVASDFHPRKCKSSKTYEYRIQNHKVLMPTERLYTHFIYYHLDVDAMREAASYIVGEHDFASFCSSNTQVLTTVRTVFSIDITEENEIIKIRIKGNGFLYNMVRIIIGTLIKVGVHNYPPEYVKTIIEAKDRHKAGPTAPAKGLTLIKIDYDFDKKA